MNKNIIYGIGGTGIFLIVLIALFSGSGAGDSNAGIMHEVRTFDAWKQSTMGGQAIQQHTIMPAAFASAPPISADAEKPVLIKEMGIEVVPTSGGKVQVAGVMGKSWAEKGGIKVHDIILEFNKKKVKGLTDFKTQLTRVAPEKDYPVKLLRNGRVKTKRVIVGEGEMEGFTPIAPVAFSQQQAYNNQGNCPLPSGTYSQVALQNNQAACFFHCGRCGNMVMGFSHADPPTCSVCNMPMHSMN